jgi:hypothetical protein
LGMRHGRGSKDERSAMERTYAKTRELMDHFSEKHGTVICRKLLNGCDLMTEEGYCQLFCVNFLSSNSFRNGRFLRTFPIGFDLQCNSIFKEINAKSI